MPEELCTEVRDIVQEAVIKTIPNEEMQKGKLLSEETYKKLRKEEKLKAKGKRKNIPI